MWGMVFTACMVFHVVILSIIMPLLTLKKVIAVAVSFFGDKGCPRAQLREGGAVAPPLPSTNQPAAPATICAGKTQSLQKMWLRVGCTSQP
jgi:hypothetical protein